VPPGGIPAGPSTGGGGTRTPTTGGGDPGLGGPSTGGGETSGPKTGVEAGGGGSGGNPGKGPSTGGGGTSPAPTPTTGVGGGGGVPSSGPTRPGLRSGGTGAGLGHWTRWWYPNRRHIIDWSTRVADREAVDTTPREGGERDDGMWRAEVQAALHDALGSRDEDLASGAAVALGKLGDASDTPALMRLLTDQSRQQPVREAAALALGLLPTGGDAADDARRALETLVRDRREPNRLRSISLYALGLRAEAGAVPLLLEAAHATSPTWDLPAASVGALGLAGFEIVQPDLIELLEGPRRAKGREAIRRAYAAQALAALGTPEAIEALRAAVADSDADVRRSAVLALGAIAQPDDDKTMDALVRVLYRDKDDASRHMAAIAVGRIGHDRGESALRHAYLKGDRMLQPFAAIALGLYSRHPGKASASTLLVNELEERANADLRGALAIAVGLSGNQAGAATLRDIAASRGDPTLRGHAAIAIGLVGDRAAGAPILRQMLTDVHVPEVQREVALGLGMLGDREAVRLLIALVEDGGSVYVQGSAAMALGRIGGPQAGAALLGVLRDERRPDLARAMAGVGLGLVLDESEGRRLASIGADLNWYLFTPTVHEVLTIL
jgi:HEAT repeat protein